MPYRAWLLLILLVLLVIGCINPVSWEDLFLEHSLTLMALGVIVALGRRRPLSNVAYTGLFLFLALHILGAHYTYSLVPYDRWFEALTGQTLSARMGWSRNHFDRLVHFSFGLLVFPTAVEVLNRRADLRGWWALLLALAAMNTFSTGYELLEWLLTMVVSPGQAATYNGQQGDVWDAHKDVGLATLGAVLAGGGMAAVSLGRGRAPAPG